MRKRTETRAGWMGLFVGILWAARLPAGAETCVWTNMADALWSNKASWYGGSMPPSSGGLYATIDGQVRVTIGPGGVTSVRITHKQAKDYDKGGGCRRL